MHLLSRFISIAPKLFPESINTTQVKRYEVYQLASEMKNKIGNLIFDLIKKRKLQFRPNNKPGYWRLKFPLLSIKPLVH